MRRLRIANLHGRISRLGVMMAAVSLLFASTVSAAEIQDLTEKLPRGFFGEFSWEGDKTVQNIVIIFDQVRALNGQNAEAMGCGTYELGRQVTRIRVRMFVRLPDLKVEIFE